MVDILKRYGEMNWSKRIADDLQFLRRGDAYGAKRFLTYFGGMGSISDLWLCEMNGHPVPKSRESAVNAEFHALRERAWQLATQAERNAV